MTAPIPADFRHWAALEPTRLLAIRYKVGGKTITAWSREIGRKALPAGIQPTPVPADFLEQQRGRSLRDLGKHYGVSREVVRRWIVQAGITVEREAQAVATRGRRKTPAILPGPRAAKLVQRDFTPASQAAEFLRKFAPVIRCRADGTYAEKGDHWRRGPSVLTAAEIIQRAERQGWRAAA